MIAALPQRRLWVPDWMRAPAWFTGGRVLKPGGRSLASGGQQFTPNATATCCLYQARKCSDGTLAGRYVKKSQFPSFPSSFTYWNGTQCLTVSASDTAPCNSTPIETSVTVVTGCSDSTCGQLYYTRYCDTGELTGLCMAAPTSPFTSRYYFTDTSLWICKYVDPADAVPTGTSCTPENPHSTNTSCSDLYCSCPPSGCTYFPSSLACSGWNGTFGNCGTSFPFTNTSCYYDTAHTTLLPLWNGVIVNSSGIPCEQYFSQSNAYGSDWRFTLADGSCGVITSVTLGCGTLFISGVYRQGWILDMVIQGGAGVSGGCGPATLRYFKRGFYPQGTYPLMTGLSGYGPCGCPDVPFSPAPLTLS